MNAKKLISLVLALVMLLALSVTAYADENTAHTITINNTKSGHTYEAYQVFKGDFENGKLVDIEWGEGVNNENLLSALKADTTLGSLFTAAQTAEDVANVISATTFTVDQVDAFAQIVGANLTTTVAGTSTKSGSSYVINVTGDGYYLVKDKDESLDGTEEDAYTKYILQVCNDVTVTAKADAPELEKKIVENNVEKDANTKDIGDTVDYKLTSSVPDMDGYNKYFFIVHDTMSDGLTFDPTSVKVTIGDNELNSTAYDVVTTDLTDGCTFEIVLKNFLQYKEQAGTEIVVTYSALINEEAEVGVNGNTNTANLEYSDNPNVDYEGQTGNHDRPKPTEPTGETPDDTVITYTTEIKLIKVDKNNHETKLTGAKFKIEDVSSNVKVINSEMYVEDAVNGTYYRLKDGTYTTTEPVAEDDPTTDGVDEKNIDSYDDPAKKYSKIEVVSQETVEEEFVAEGWVNEDGEITFTGLGEGTYTITELVAPNGYNLLKAPITVVVTSNVATITDPTSATTVTWTAKDGAGDSAKNWTVTTEGKIEIEVENTSGTELPSTGGMGTTMIYIAGGLLVAAAVILLVTKRRMAAE